MNPEEQDPLDGSPDPDPTGAGATNWDAEDNPYKKRFEDYRREADRKATEYSEYQRNVSDLSSDDPDRRVAAAEALGVELVDDEPDDSSYVDPAESRLAALEAREQKREQTMAQERLANEVERRLDKLSLSDEPDESGWSEKDWVLARAVQQPDANGVPDVAAAHAELKKLEAAVERKWAASKKAPRSIQPGSTATEQKDVAAMSDIERVEHMTRMLEDRATA